MSEKKQSPKGKPSIVRKKASATMPSPVSAEMAATLRPDSAFRPDTGAEDPMGMNFDDDATRISTDMAGLAALIAPASETAPTPAPGDYDPKDLSGSDAGTSESTDAAAVQVAKPGPPRSERSSPALIARKPANKAEGESRAAASATRETPAIVMKSAGASEANRSPTKQVPVRVEEGAAAKSSGKGSGKLYLFLGALVLGAAGVGIAFVLGGQDTTEVEVAVPVKVTHEPADDSVGNLIKKADEKFVAGELVGDGGALSLLVAARVANPDDQRIVLRLEPLADKFEELGEAALKAGGLEEAVGHFKNSIEADPTRTSVAQKLEKIEAELKAAETKSK